MNIVFRTIGGAARIVGQGVRAALVAVVAVSVAVTGVAIANYNMTIPTTGTLTPFGSIVVSTIHYAQQLICDPTTPANCGSVKAGNTAGTTDVALVVADPNLLAAANAAIPAGTNAIGGISVTPTATNPTSTLTQTAATTAYSANQLIASSATAGSVVVPSFALANTAGAATISRLRLSTNDNTSTAWPAASIQIDLWSAAPTFTNGDRAAFAVATGVAGHLGSFTCTVSAEYGDGAYAECSPNVGSFVMPKLASGTSVFWTMKALNGSGVTGASKVWTVTAELMN